MLKKVNKKKVSFSTVFTEIKSIDRNNYDLISEIIFFKYKLTTFDFIKLYDSMKLKKKFGLDDQSFLSKVIFYLSKFEEKKIEEYITIYKPLLLGFINSDCLDENEFFKDKNILQKALDYAFIVDFSFYTDFFDVVEKKKDTLMKMNLVAGVEIVKCIETGVENEDGSIREFDIIDYYTYTKLPPIKMVLLLRKYVNSPNLLFLKKFANKNDNDFVLRKNDIERRLADRTVYNCKLDENGKIIPDSGIEISDVDKLFIFDYLRKNNIPVTDLTYAAGLRRFKRGIFKHKESETEKELIMK
ncbi:MAG: hypothetical protein IK997_00480 [Bacilli bacterium]|nr:hypothetical protein [Bacilli bacterium]